MDSLFSVGIGFYLTLYKTLCKTNAIPFLCISCLSISFFYGADFYGVDFLILLSC